MGLIIVLLFGKADLGGHNFPRVFSPYGIMSPFIYT